MYAPIISVFPSKPNFHCLQFCTAPFVDYAILPAGCATTHDAPHWCQQNVHVSDEINCAKGLRDDDESRNSWKLPHNIPTVRAVKSCVFFAVLWKVVRASSECLRARAYSLHTLAHSSIDISSDHTSCASTRHATSAIAGYMVAFSNYLIGKQISHRAQFERCTPRLNFAA